MKPLISHKVLETNRKWCIQRPRIYAVVVTPGRIYSLIYQVLVVIYQRIQWILLFYFTDFRHLQLTYDFHHYQVCKIVLPHNLRYLENMLNADVVAKAAKIRQRMEANPNNQDSDKGWPMLLAKYQADDKNNRNFNPSNMYGGIYNRRYQNY